MAIALYMDQPVPRAITTGLRLRGVDVITAYEDGADRMDDSEFVSTDVWNLARRRASVYNPIIALNIRGG